MAQILRHEEFSEGCKATCNGPYNGKWSKTMVGYGPEDDHFVVELTYNYGIDKYKLGNDFQGITIASTGIAQQAKASGHAVEETNGIIRLEAPDGYPIFVDANKEAAAGTEEDPVQSVAIACSSLEASLAFWRDLLGMKSSDDAPSELRFEGSRLRLALQPVASKGAVTHEAAFGRIAFAVPAAALPDIEKRVKDSGNAVLTPLTKLDTPGKATVEVVIVADPVGIELRRAQDMQLNRVSRSSTGRTRNLLRGRRGIQGALQVRSNCR